MILSESQAMKVIDSHLCRAVQIIKDVVDQEIAKMENMNEDD